MQVWQDVEGHLARMQHERCAATVDWHNPRAGLCDVRLDGQILSDFHPLGVELAEVTAADSTSAADHHASAEHYVRGGDLVATYPDRPAEQLRTQVYWRAGTHPRDGAIAAIELVVSVQTALLDSCPKIAIASHLHASEALRMTDSQSGAFTSIVPPSGEADPDGIAGAPHCYLFRLPGRQYSYIEMIHPADVQNSNWDGWLHGAHYRLQLRHELFADRLEKGVILRARVLGVIVDRRDDKAAALRHWQRFLTEQLPLTT
jgi:hypothetical protein